MQHELQNEPGKVLAAVRGKMLEEVQIGYKESPVDHELRAFAWKTGPFPGFKLFPHQPEVPLHRAHSNREDVTEAQVLGLFRKHGGERAWDAKDNRVDPRG